jgi:hypothetical protein
MYLDDAGTGAPMAVPGLYNGILGVLAALVFIFGLFWSPLVRWAATAFT